MTLTRERTAPEPTLRPVPAEEIEIPPSWRPDPPRLPLGERVAAYLGSPVSPVRAAVVGTGWMALFLVVLAVEPVPADPEAVPSAYELIFSLALLGAMGAMFVGLAHRRRAGLVAAAVASGLLVVASVGCLATGHHTFGTWWLAQVGAAGGALGLSVGSLRGS